MNNLSVFGDSLQDLMITRNVKPDDIHKATKISLNVIYAWLRNEIMPKLNSLIILADYFDCSVDYLCGRREQDTFAKSTNPSQFCDRLRHLMNSSGISIRKLSAETKISTSGIHRFLTNTGKPLLDNLIRLTVYFDCSIDYLLGREN